MSPRVAARRAFEERLARIRARRAASPAAADLQEIIHRGRLRAVLDARSDDEILGYGPDGLPS